MRKTRSLLLMLVLSFILIFTTSCDPVVVVPVDIDHGNYEKRFDDVGFNVMGIDATIAKGEDKIAAMEHLLLVAETNWDNADHVAKISSGSGEAYTGGMGGKMTVRSLYLRNNDSFYYQTAGRITEAEPAAGLSAAQAMLDQGRREYSPDMVTFYQQEPGSKGTPTMTETFPYFTCDYTKKALQTFDEEGWKQERNVKDKIGEFTSFIFNGDTVKHDSVEVTYNETFKYYTLYFELNLEDETARDLATEFPRATLRKIANSNNIEYSLYKFTMEIWDNGLIRSIATEESWSGQISVWIMTLNGSSASTNKDYFSWDPDDSSYENNNIDLSWIN